MIRGLVVGFVTATILLALLGASPTSHVANRLDTAALRLENQRLRDQIAVRTRQVTRWRQGYLYRGRQINTMDRRIANLDRVARHGFDYPHLIHLAAIAYGVDRVMLERRGRCESVNFTDFFNETPIYNGEHAQGAFGFIPSTWRSTPFGRFSILDPFAHVLAAAWMHGPAGRGGEWACR